MAISDSQLLEPPPLAIVPVARPAVSPGPPPLPPQARASEPPSPAESNETGESPFQRWGNFFITVPSWAVSMIVHMIVVIVLALCTVEPKIADNLIVLEASYKDPTEDLFEEPLRTIEFEAPTEHRFAAIEAPGDVGVADFGNASEVSSTLASLDEGDLNIGEGIGEVGQLFGTEGTGMAAAGAGSGGAEFFGVKATGKRFVFIVDSSKSMRNGKFEAACEELFYAVQRLKSDQYFYVIFFDQNAARMTFAPKEEPEDTYAQATTANINKLQKWMKTIELEGQTVPHDAFVFARKLSPDAIYLLTDGEFTDGGRSEDYLRASNLYKDPEVGLVPKSVVHTIGFWDPDGESTLRTIAKEHQGTYRFVARPKPKQALPRQRVR
jgi:hypothetical protein